MGFNLYIAIPCVLQVEGALAVLAPLWGSVDHVATQIILAMNSPNGLKTEIALAVILDNLCSCQCS